MQVLKPTIIETVRLHRLRWFGHVQRVEETRIPKRVLCMNFGTTRLTVDRLHARSYFTFPLNKIIQFL